MVYILFPAVLFVRQLLYTTTTRRCYMPLFMPRFPHWVCLQVLYWLNYLQKACYICRLRKSSRQKKEIAYILIFFSTFNQISQHRLPLLREEGFHWIIPLRTMPLTERSACGFAVLGKYFYNMLGSLAFGTDKQSGITYH